MRITVEIPDEEMRRVFEPLLSGLLRGRPEEPSPDKGEGIGRQPSKEDRRVLLTVRDVAAKLGIGRSKAYELVRSGSLGSVRIGRLCRVPAHCLDAFLARGEDGPGGFGR